MLNGHSQPLVTSEWLALAPHVCVCASHEEWDDNGDDDEDDCDSVIFVLSSSQSHEKKNHSPYASLENCINWSKRLECSPDSLAGARAIAR